MHLSAHVVKCIGLSFLGMVFPLTIGILALAGALGVVFSIRRGRVAEIHDDDASAAVSGTWSGREMYLAVFAALVGLVWLIGFVPAMALFFPTFLIVAGKARPLQAALLTIGAVGFISGITWAMTLRLPGGIIPSLLF